MTDSTSAALAPARPTWNWCGERTQHEPHEFIQHIARPGYNSDAYLTPPTAPVIRECSGLPIVEGADDLAQWCEDCDVRLLPDNKAATCWVHRLCVNCEPHRTDTCRECQREREGA